MYMSDGSRIFDGAAGTLLPETMIAALLQLAAAWREETSPWLVGGSIGLVLQGVEVGTAPRDLDVYTDKPHVPGLHGRLRRYAEDEPAWSETGMYRSYLSHYRVEGAAIELVGSLEVETGGSRYAVEVGEILAPLGVRTKLNERTIPLMPLSHELLFNVLRGRADRYERIAEAMRADWPRQAAPLRRVLARCRLSPEAHGLLQRLLPGLAAAGFTEGDG